MAACSDSGSECGIGNAKSTSGDWTAGGTKRVSAGSAQLGCAVSGVGLPASTGTGIIVVNLEQVVAAENASWRISGDGDSCGLASEFLAGGPAIIVVVNDFVEVEQSTKNFGGDSDPRINDKVSDVDRKIGGSGGNVDGVLSVVGYWSS